MLAASKGRGNYRGTDIAKITGKRSKPDKHGHGNRKSAQEPGFSSKDPRNSYKGIDVADSENKVEVGLIQSLDCNRDPDQRRDQTTRALLSRIFTLELRDLPQKINQTVNEVVKEAVHVTLQAPLQDRFRELPEADMKEILHQRMFESGSYKSLPEHVALFEALKASMEHANRDEFLAEKDNSSKQKFVPHFEQPVKDVPILDDVNISDSEDTVTAHLPKIKTKPDWLKPVLEEDRPETLEPDWVIPTNDLPEPENNWANAFANSKSKLSKADLEGPAYKIDFVIRRVTQLCAYLVNLSLGDDQEEGMLVYSKLKAAFYPDFGLEELVPSLWIKSEQEYDISAAYDITHWWFKQKEFYITRYSAPSDCGVVRSHMRILSVIRLNTYERYDYHFLKEIVLRRADYNEYKISEVGIKNLHLNDFEDLYLLHLQGQLNHLSGADKLHLFNAVNLWIRNIVIRKQDYTIVSKPSAIIYKDRNDQKKMMRETKVHKFSDGTLTRILEKLDHMVKDFKLFKYNPGMESKIWSKDDRRRSKDFMEVIKRRLKIRRIFRSLEGFVSGMLRDVDYRLISRTE
ncbi:hypothetical protein Tco_0015940 [Tanacetum coccineum]